MAVLKILKSGKVYRAYKSQSFYRAYSALADMLGLQCESPIFGSLRFHRKCTNGRVSTSVKLVLKVPNEFVKLTEYAVWADFMEAIKLTKPGDYRQIDASVKGDGDQEFTQKVLDRIIQNLKTQRHFWQYYIPQAVMAEIRPEWLVRYELHPKEPHAAKVSQHHWHKYEKTVMMKRGDPDDEEEEWIRNGRGF